MKTAIEQLIERYQKEQNALCAHPKKTPNNFQRIKWLDSAIGELQCLLPTEQQQITDAFLAGHKDAMSPNPIPTAGDYYTNTFKK